MKRVERHNGKGRTSVVLDDCGDAEKLARYFADKGFPATLVGVHNGFQILIYGKAKPIARLLTGWP